MWDIINSEGIRIGHFREREDAIKAFNNYVKEGYVKQVTQTGETKEGNQTDEY